MGVSKNIAILATHEGYGFDGIAVSLIGSNSPFGAMIAGFFLGALKYSGQKIQSALEAPSEVIGIMIGVIIFFVAIPIILERPINKILKFKERK
jgi:simple sugar transport system permease protein